MSVRITNTFGEPTAEVLVFPMKEGRICIAIYSGATVTHLRPTAAEALKLIAERYEAQLTELRSMNERLLLVVEKLGGGTAS